MSEDHYEYDFQRLDSSFTNGSNEVESRNGSLEWNIRDQMEEFRIWMTLAVPTMILCFAQQSTSLIDMAFLGHFNTNTTNSSTFLAASSQATLVIDSSIAIFTKGFMQVLTVLGSQAYGAEKYTLVGEWLQLSVMVSFILTIPLIFVWWNCGAILNYLFDISADVESLSTTFSRWSILRIYPAVMYGLISQFCVVQNIIYPLLAIGVCGIFVNVIMNYILIYGIGSVGGFGFSGSPMATAFTSIFVCLASLYYVFVYKREDTKKCWPGIKTSAFGIMRVKEILKQGIPLTVSTCLEDFQLQTINAFVIHISRIQGDWVMGAHNGLLSFFLTFTSFQWGTMKATSVRCGHHIGAQDSYSARMVLRLSFIVSTAMSFITGVVFLLLRHHIGSIISDKPEIVEEVAILIVPVAIGYCAMSLFYISMAVLEAQGRPQVVAVAFLVGGWLIAVPTAYVLGVSESMYLPGIWDGLIGGYTITTLISVYAVYHSDWKAILKDSLRRNHLEEVVETITSSPRPVSIFLEAESIFEHEASAVSLQ